MVHFLRGIYITKQQMLETQILLVSALYYMALPLITSCRPLVSAWKQCRLTILLCIQPLG